MNNGWFYVSNGTTPWTAELMYRMFSTCLIDIDGLIANVFSGINQEVVNLNIIVLSLGISSR